MLLVVSQACTDTLKQAIHGCNSVMGQMDQVMLRLLCLACSQSFSIDPHVIDALVYTLEHVESLHNVRECMPAVSSFS